MLNADVYWAGGNQIGGGCSFSITGRSRLQVGAETALTGGARFFVRGGVLEIGARGFVGYGAIVSAQERITIGNDVLIAEYVTIRDQEHRFECGATTWENGFDTAPIVIGNNVWLGAKVTVLKGVTIGNNVVVGANSVVTHDLPDNTVAVGAPARVIREIGFSPTKA